MRRLFDWLRRPSLECAMRVVIDAGYGVSRPPEPAATIPNEAAPVLRVAPAYEVVGLGDDLDEIELMGAETCAEGLNNAAKLTGLPVAFWPCDCGAVNFTPSCWRCETLQPCGDCHEHPRLEGYEVCKGCHDYRMAHAGQPAFVDGEPAELELPDDWLGVVKKAAEDVAESAARGVLEQTPGEDFIRPKGDDS